MKSDKKNNKTDIIEFLIECLVISKLGGIDNVQINSNFRKKFKNSLRISHRLIDIKMEKLINVKQLEKDYSNFDLVYSYNE